jgi:hypothetical protein
MSTQRNSGVSWTVVIIMMILFWPIGVFLLISKLANDRTASFGAGAGIVRFIGYILLFFGVIILLVTISEPDMVGASIFASLIFILPGLWLLKKGRQVRAKGNINRRYIDMIINNQVREIPDLAHRMGLPQSVVMDDVQRMINGGMLGRARLNRELRIIQFPKPKPRTEQPTYQRPSTPVRDVPTPSRQRPQDRPAPIQQPQHEFKPFEPKTIRCSSCSANNFVESLPARCEYCGTSLHE